MLRMLHSNPVQPCLSLVAFRAGYVLGLATLSHPPLLLPVAKANTFNATCFKPIKHVQTTDTRPAQRHAAHAL